MKPRAKKSLANCRCPARKRMRKRLQDDVGDPPNILLPHFLQTMAVFNIRFPYIPDMADEMQEYISLQLVDENIKRTLENARCLNWCPNTTKLYPIFTLGDGNCLTHAASLFMWGVDDRHMFLRRFIYASLAGDSTGPEFRRRWLLEKKLHNSAIPDGGLDLMSAEWDTEWERIVKIAEETKNTTDPNRLAYECLEEIHIFVLTNILRRPIIVLCEAVIRSIQGSSIGPNNCGGIYLPLLWEPIKCTKQPIVISYNEQHFSPLVPPDSDEQIMNAVPLISGTQEPLVVHFTTETEQRKINSILQDYLQTTEVPFTKKDGLVQILCAKLHKSDTPPELDVMHEYLQEMETNFRQDFLENQRAFTGQSMPLNSLDDNLGPNIPTDIDLIPQPSLASVPCDTPGCPFFALPEHGCLCSGCLNKYLAAEASSVRRPPSDQTYLMRPLGLQREPVAPTAPHHGMISETMEPMLVHEDLSLLNVGCKAPECGNHSSYKTYPYCYDHKRDSIGQELRRSFSRASSLNEYLIPGDVSSGFMYLMNRQGSRSMESLSSTGGSPQSCEEMGCRLYCPPGQKYCEHHLQERANCISPQACEELYCRLLCLPGQRFCEQHQQERTNYSSFDDADVSLIGGKPIMHPSTNEGAENICRTSECSNAAQSSDHFNGMCSSCFIKESSCTDEIADPGPTENPANGEINSIQNSLNVSPSDLVDISRQPYDHLNDLNSGLAAAAAAPAPAPKQSSASKPSVEHTSRKQQPKYCKNDSCKEMPFPECRGYCSSCYRFVQKDKQLASELRHTAPGGSLKHASAAVTSQRLCTKPGCDNLQSKNPKGLCYNCSRGEHITPKVQAQAHVQPHVQPHVQQPQVQPQVQRPRVRPTTERSPSFPHRSHPHRMSLGGWESVPNRSSWQQGPKKRYISQDPREMFSAEPYVSVRPCRFQGCTNIMEDPSTELCYRCYNILCDNIPRSHIQEGRSHCRRAGCEYYGNPEQDGYCSRCFRGFMSSSARSRLPRTYSPPLQTHGFREQRVQIGDDRKSNSDPLSNSMGGDVTSGTELLERIECSARGIANKCLTPGCNHLGNTKCLGYCNACFTLSRKTSRY